MIATRTALLSLSIGIAAAACATSVDSTLPSGGQSSAAGSSSSLLGGSSGTGPSAAAGTTEQGGAGTSNSGANSGGNTAGGSGGVGGSESEVPPEPGDVSFSELTASATSLGIYAQLTVTFHSSIAFQNPFDQEDIKVDLMALAPDGSAVTMPAFFSSGSSGDATWEAHFTPRQQGRYHYRAHVTHAGSTSNTASRTVRRAPCSRCTCCTRRWYVRSAIPNMSAITDLVSPCRVSSLANSKNTWSATRANDTRAPPAVAARATCNMASCTTTSMHASELTPSNGPRSRLPSAAAPRSPRLLVS